MSSSKSQTGRSTPPPAKPGLAERLRPAAFTGSRFNPYRIGAVVVGLAVAVSAATYVGNQAQDDGSSTTTRATPSASAAAPSSPAPSATPSLSPGDQFKLDVLQDYGPLNGVVISYQQTLQLWDAGKVTDAQLSGLFSLGVARFSETRDSLAKRAPFAAAPRALEEYRVAAALFLESARIGQVGLQVPAGPLRNQFRFQVNRLRNLGDRAFDQAKLEVEAAGPAGDVDPNLQITRGAEVPDFAFGGIAPGAPLDTAPAKPAAQRTFDKDKPQQPFADWAALVREAPTARQLADAVTTGTTSDRQAISRRLTATADALYAAPDPRDERRTGVRVQLGLLIGAEAGRAAQASGLVTGVTRTSLTAVAQRLVLLSDLLWDPRLGTRDSGLPEDLLAG